MTEPAFLIASPLPSDAALRVTHASLDALIQRRPAACRACRGGGYVHDDPAGVHGPPGDCDDCDGTGLEGGESQDAQELPRSHRMLCPGPAAAGRQHIGWGCVRCPWCGRGTGVSSWRILSHVGVGVMRQP